MSVWCLKQGKEQTQGKERLCSSLAILVRNSLAPQNLACADAVWKFTNNLTILDPDLATPGQRPRPALIHLDSFRYIRSLEGPSLVGEYMAEFRESFLDVKDVFARDCMCTYPK